MILAAVTSDLCKESHSNVHQLFFPLILISFPKDYLGIKSAGIAVLRRVVFHKSTFNIYFSSFLYFCIYSGLSSIFFFVFLKLRCFQVLQLIFWLAHVLAAQKLNNFSAVRILRTVFISGFLHVNNTCQKKNPKNSLLLP